MIDIRDFVLESCDVVVGQRRHILMYHKLISVQKFFNCVSHLSVKVVELR